MEGAIAIVNRSVVIRRRPDGIPQDDDFAVEENPVEAVPDGQVLLRADTLSIDAWIRTTLDGAGMHEEGALGSIVRAFGIGQVVESASDTLAEGDWVFGMLCAQTHPVLPADSLSKIELAPGIEPSAHIGPLGLTTGLTAWVGLVAVGEVQEGDTVLVSGAAGAVGSCVVQLAKARGARVIGIAGGPQKCAYLVDELGADAAIDYKHEDVAARLAALAPDGVDVFFDNVGGTILDAALDNLAPAGARVVICGAISQYDDLNNVQGPRLYLRLAERNASMRGFVVTHHAARFDEARREIAELIRAGNLALREHVVEPIEKFPQALRMLFTGGHIGNLTVRP